MSTDRKSVVFLSVLVLCTACAPQSLPTVNPSSELTATQPSLTTTETSTPFSPTLTTTPTPSLPPVLDVVIDDLAIGGQGQLYASGYGTGLQQVPQPQLAHWDGAKWIALDTGFQTGGGSLAVDRAGHLYAEVFTDSQQGLSNAIMRWDGTTWEDITGNFGEVVDARQAGRISSNIPVVALAVDGEDHLYAAGAFFYPNADHTNEFPMGYVAKWDQETWTVLGKGFDKVNIFALAVSDTGDVYVSGEQPLTPEGNSSYMARWDGEQWTEIDTSKLSANRTIALDQSGRLYASGQWNALVETVGYWDGTDWIPIADRFEGEAPVVLDMAADANGHLYIGGSFEAVNGIPARNMAYWDGSSWHALGEGTNKEVHALALDPSGDLYAVGLFTEAGGVPANHVAYWNGETWYALAP